MRLYRQFVGLLCVCVCVCVCVREREREREREALVLHHCLNWIFAHYEFVKMKPPSPSCFSQLCWLQNAQF
jgi:hypothetical protein